MSLTTIPDAAALEAALSEAGDGLLYVGFFGAYSPLATEVQPAFEAFAAEDESRACLLVDVGVAKGAHKLLGVKTVPTVVAVRSGQVIREAAGRNNAEAYERLLVPHDALYASGADGDSKPRQPPVVVYTTPTCSWCTRLKNYLRTQKVRFREVDVSRDKAAADALVQRSGQMGVPQTDIGGQMVVGFDQAKIDRLLGLPKVA